jgi:outer membrane protein TolC
MPANFEAGFAGDVEMMQDSAAAMGLALLLAVAFIYIVLASQFESFTEPMLIMLSLPLALVGALLALLVTGNHIGMPAMIGVVMLMGLVTKNAILLVDYTNQLHRDEGLSVTEALLKAGPVRLRPIVMTTLAMILGMVPSALGRGDGGEFRAPISIATIGGLLTSTLLTLVVVPVSYLLLQRFLAWLKAFRNVEKPALSPALRVTGAIILVLLLGGLIAAANAFGEPLPQTSARKDTAVTAPLTFEAALEIALRDNKALKVEHEKVHEAEGRVAEAKANFLPSANLSFQYTPAQEFPTIRIPAGIFGPQEQTFQAAFTRQNIMQLDFSQPLYTGGRLRNTFGLQAAAADGARLTLDRARQQLTLQVVETFYRALLQEQGVGVAEQGVRLAEEQLAIAKTRFDAGSAARFDVLRAEVDVANARTTLIRARTAVDIAYQALRTVLSLPAETPLTLQGTLEQVSDLPAQEMLLSGLDRRPDLRAITSQRQMAERSAAIASGEMQPSFSLNGNLQYQEDVVSRSFLDPTNRSYTVGFAMRIPLFATPGAVARRTTARAQIQEAIHGLDAALDNGRLEVTSAYTEWTASHEVVEAQRKALDLARESLSIAQVSYENGLITSIELSDARQALVETEWNLAQAKFAQILAAAKTRYAAGLS